MYTVRFELRRDAIEGIKRGENIFDPTHLIKGSAKRFAAYLEETFHIERIYTTVNSFESYIDLLLEGPSNFTPKLQKALALLIEEDVCENYYATFADIVEN